MNRAKSIRRVLLLASRDRRHFGSTAIETFAPDMAVFRRGREFDYRDPGRPARGVKRAFRLLGSINGYWCTDDANVPLARLKTQSIY